jgi:hypothetical protein
MRTIRAPLVVLTVNVTGSGTLFLRDVDVTDLIPHADSGMIVNQGTLTAGLAPVSRIPVPACRLP